MCPPDVGSYGRQPRMRPRLSTHLENGDGWIREGWLPSPLSRLASSLTSPLLSVHLLPPSLSFLPRRLSLQSTELRVSAYPKIEEHKTRFSDSINSVDNGRSFFQMDSFMVLDSSLISRIRPGAPKGESQHYVGFEQICFFVPSAVTKIP